MPSRLEGSCVSHSIRGSPKVGMKSEKKVAKPEAKPEAKPKAKVVVPEVPKIEELENPRMRVEEYFRRVGL